MNHFEQGQYDTYGSLGITKTAGFMMKRMLLMGDIKKMYERQGADFRKDKKHYKRMTVRELRQVRSNLQSVITRKMQNELFSTR